MIGIMKRSGESNGIGACVASELNWNFQAPTHLASGLVCLNGVQGIDEHSADGNTTFLQVGYP
eukprot:CAMPEP_0114234504 /NCGR_PEP_ID=MMETSP0058-20121206/5745_1 /TAXON_ID=36894 /ORGANISM="Pyramimonas parkeae, CCMP726" /LENGTH=62 /DNA_ID=CAMNT_0001346189 /DNA_START=643 /DNA_END=831 /DNA_ORIENTATION=+